MIPKRKIENLIIKERAAEPSIFNQVMSGLRAFTETVLFISVGAAVTAWEKIGKIWNSEPAVNPGQIPKPAKSPKSSASEPKVLKVKVPLLPIDNYQQLTADQVIERLNRLSADQLKTVGLFESSHKKRKSVLETIERLRNRTEL